MVKAPIEDNKIMTDSEIITNKSVLGHDNIQHETVSDPKIIKINKIMSDYECIKHETVPDTKIIKTNKTVSGVDYIIQYETVCGTEIASVTETNKQSQNDGVDRYEVRKGGGMRDKVEKVCREASVARKLKDQLWLHLLISEKIMVRDQSFLLEYLSLVWKVIFSKDSSLLNYKRRKKD